MSAGTNRGAGSREKKKRGKKGGADGPAICGEPRTKEKRKKRRGSRGGIAFRPSIAGASIPSSGREKKKGGKEMWRCSPAIFYESL